VPRKVLKYGAGEDVEDRLDRLCEKFGSIACGQGREQGAFYTE